MDQARNFLDKYQNITPPDETVRQTVVKVINERLGTHLDKSVVQIQNGIARLRVSSAVRSTIFINKESLLSTLKERLGENKTPKDIL